MNAHPVDWWMSDHNEEEVRELLDIQEVEYRLSLLKLRKALPRLELSVSDLVIKGVPVARSMSRRGACGRGRLPQYPWELYEESLGHCFCDACSEHMVDWRCEIMGTYDPNLWCTCHA